MDPFSIVVKDLLVAAGLGRFAGTGDWGIYVGSEPDSPTNCITVYDVGEPQERPITLARTVPVDAIAAQARVRAQTYAGGWDKAEAILAQLAAVNNTLRTEDGAFVRYACIKPQQSAPVPLGRDARQRFLFVVNLRARRWSVTSSATGSATT